MSRKKGFTLIELLAVIVILGIIVTLTFVIVDKYIGYAEESAIKETLKSVERASETYFANNNIKDAAIIDLTTNEIKLNQNLIEKGQVLGNRNFSKLYLYQDGYCGFIEKDNIIVKKIGISECDWDIFNNNKFIDNRNILKNEDILGYRIYGNTNEGINLGDSGQITLKLSGKNILDKNKFRHDGLRDETAVAIWAATVLDNNWVKENLKPSTTYTVSFDATCLNVPEYTEKYSSNNGFYLYTSAMSGQSDFLNIPDKYYTLNENYKSVETITTSQYLYDSSLNFVVLGYTNAYKKDGTLTFSTILYKNIQIEEGSIATPYEPYLNPIEYKISIDEPLREYNGAVDYIDSNISQIVRNVGVNFDGTLYKLATPTYEHIKLPEISNLDGTTVISSYDEGIEASKIQILLNN